MRLAFHPPTSSAFARSSPQDFVFPRWSNHSGIDPPTNGSTPSAQRWRATTAEPGLMPKFRNMVSTFSMITSTESSRKPNNHSQSRPYVCRVSPLILYQRPFIELVKTPGRKRHPQTKAKSAVPSSSRLRSVLTASIEVCMLDVATLVETKTASRNRKRKMIKPSHQMPSHRLSSMPETRRILSRVRSRLAHNWSSLRPPTYSYHRLSKSPTRRNKWSSQHWSPIHQPNLPTYHNLLFDRLVLNRNLDKTRSSLMSLRMVHPLPPQSHL